MMMNLFFKMKSFLWTEVLSPSAESPSLPHGADPISSHWVQILSLPSLWGTDPCLFPVGQIPVSSLWDSDPPLFPVGAQP